MNIKNVICVLMLKQMRGLHVRGFSAFGLWVVFIFLNLPAKEHDLSDMSEIKLKDQNAHGKFREQRLTHTE